MIGRRLLTSFVSAGCSNTRHSTTSTVFRASFATKSLAENNKKRCRQQRTFDTDDIE